MLLVALPVLLLSILFDRGVPHAPAAPNSGVSDSAGQASYPADAEGRTQVAERAGVHAVDPPRSKANASGHGPGPYGLIPSATGLAADASTPMTAAATRASPIHCILAASPRAPPITA